MRTSFEPHRYAAHLKKSGRYASEDDLLYEWTGTHWQVHGDKELQREAYLWLVKRDIGHASADNAKKAVRAALLFADAMPESAGEVFIPCRNGTVVMRDSSPILVPADPAFGLRYVIDCDYAAAPPPPVRFEKFLNRILPDADVRARVQEYVGYTLMPDARFQRAQLWIGEGANGKGVLANIIQALHGSVAAVKLNDIDRFTLASLIGASLIYVDEIPHARIDEQTVKSLIAGETLSADRKYLDHVSVKLTGKLLALGNHLPVVTDHSAGFWRRWDVVPFDVVVPQRERSPLLASTIIAKELSGVLNWALIGLQRLLIRGDFDPVLPPPMAVMLKDARIETNSVLAWIEDRGITLTTTITTPKDSVFADYRKWCERNALMVLGATMFWKRLHQSLPQLVHVRTRIHGAQVRVCNICLSQPG